MLKKTLAILCAFALLASVLVVSFSASAVENTTDECYTVIESEDFENVTLPSDLNYNSSAWYNKSIITKDNCFWYAGTQVRLTTSFGSTTSIQTRPYFGALRLYVNVESGKTYNFSWRVRDNDPDVQGTYAIQTRYCNSYEDTSWVSGSAMTTQKTFVGKESFSGWENNDYTFTATRNAKICLSFGGEGAIQFCFDNFVLKEINHDINVVDAVAPTATEDGIKAHYACSKCGTLYTDAKGTTETTLADLMDRECNVVVNETFDNFSVTSADLVDSGKRFTKNSNGTYWHVYNASKIKLWESGGSYGFTAPSVGYTNAAGVVGTGFRMANVTGTTVFYVCFDVVKGRTYNFSFTLWNNTSDGQDGLLRLRKVTGYDETNGAPALGDYLRFVGSSDNDVGFNTPYGDNVLSYSFKATETTTLCINMQIYSAVGKYSVLDNFKVEESGHTYTKVETREANCVNDGIAEHYTCTSCGKNWADEAKTQYIDPAVPAVEHNHVFGNYNIRLDGKIGLGFNASLCDGLIADPSSTYVQFAIEGEEATKEVYLNDAVLETNGTYTFYCPLTSVQMGKQVTAYLCYQGNVLDTETASANDYIEDLESAEEGTVDEKILNLAAATKNYTAFAETYFAGEEIADTVEAEANVDYNYAESGSAEGVEFYGYDLVLNDGTDLRLYFKADVEPTFTVGGESVEAKQYIEGYYYVTISNIAAHELNKKFTVVANGGLTVEACALSYANSVIKANNNKNLVKLCKALYNYSNAAAAYNAQ